MPSFKKAIVVEILVERPGLQRLLVQVESDVVERAYVLTQLIGRVAPGDEVIVNTTAVELGLGTGGWHVVHWNLSRTSWSRPGPGHVMKLRYTGLQVDTGVAEELEDFSSPKSLAGVPVIACFLHSQVAIVAAMIRNARPDARIAYVMTDQASLPFAISDLGYELRQKALLDVVITVGQAFGGDLEAVNTASALGVAVASTHADFIIVGQGPGVVGTSTALGFSGLELAAVVNEAAHQDGRPVLALRWSDADERERHRDLSHHSHTVLSRIGVPVDIGVPSTHQSDALLSTLKSSGTGSAVVSTVDVPDISEVMSRFDLEVTTMGRGLTEDPGFFRFTAAAAVAALNLASV